MSVECSAGKVPPGYKQTEIGVIPEDWQLRPLLNAVKVASGQVDPKIEPYCSMILVAPDHIESNSGRLLKKETAQDQHAISGKYLFAAGDIVYSKIRPYLRKAILSDFEGLCSADMYPLKPFADMSAGFLFAVILGYHFSKYAESVSVRSGIPKINREELAGYTIAFPPTKAEQEAIAETLSNMDALIESLEQLIAKKQQIKQGTMQELLTGKRRLPGFGEDKGYKQTDLGVIPKDWEVVYLADVGRSLTGLTYSPSNVKDFGTLVLRSSNIQNGKLVFEDNVYVDMALPERVIVEKDDILICVRNGSRQLIGKCALINEHAAGNAFGAFMSVYRSEYSKYLFYQFQSEIIQRQINEIMGATINQITNKDMASFIVPFPQSDEEKNTIATILSDMDSEITVLEEKLDKARQIKQGMMQELLTGRIRLL